MNVHELLGLAPTHNRFRWQVTVGPGQSSSAGNLFGGVGLGAAIAAMEAVTQRQCVWATAQFLAFAPAGSIVDLDVREVVSGRSVSQLRATGHIEDHEIFTVNAAFGHRSFPSSGEFAQRPQVAPPDACPLRETRLMSGGTVFDVIEVRLASGRQYGTLDGVPSSDGRSALWARFPQVNDSSSAPLLAVLGDFVPSGVGQALGIKAGGTSLDNTIRVVQPCPTEWVLLDVRVHAVEGGFAHGLVHQWSDSGVLLASCSQSVVARMHAAPKKAPGSG